MKAVYFMSGHTFLPYIGSLIAAYGIEHAVISPGSRNAPLIRMLLSVEGLKSHQMIDERAAGFTALGMAIKQEKPVLLCCTSGTAVLNLYPAICEAYYSRIPLIVITADRPPEMIDQWDGQCIRQNNIFSLHIGKSLHLDHSVSALSARKVLREIFHFAEQRHQPVHINIALEEPLYEEQFDANLNDSELQVTIKSLPESTSSPGRIQPIDFPERIFRKIMVLYGAHAPAFDFPQGVVVLSDFLSGQKKEQNITHWDALLTICKDPELSPDLLITCGTYTISKGLKQFLRGHPPVMHLHIDHGQGFGNMFQTRPVILTPDEFQHLKSEELILAPDQSYLMRWRNATETLNKKMRTLFAEAEWNEFAAVEYVLTCLPENAVLHISNSMPVRYVSWLDSLSATHLICANRGTSGIDGCTSTAVGYAMCSEDPVYLLTGDVSFFYDINGLWNPELPSNLKIIVLNNFGGSIFRMLDGPLKYPEALRFQETAHNRSALGMATEFGLEYFCALNFQELKSAFKTFSESQGPAILEIQTNKSKNTAFYQQFKHMSI